MQNVEIGIGNRLKCMPQSWKYICSRKITQSEVKTYFLRYTHFHAKCTCAVNLCTAPGEMHYVGCCRKLCETAAGALYAH